MEQNIFKQMLYKMPAYLQGRDALVKDKSPIVYHEMGETAKPHLIYGMVEDLQCSALLITYNEVEANTLYQDLSFFLGERAMHFPAEPSLYYFAEAYSPEISIQRLKVLEALKNEEKKVVVASIEAIMKKMLPMEVFKDYWTSIKVGQFIGIEELQKKLRHSAYERVEEVESPGQYNVRGGIVDVFSMVEQQPYRIEFFDDQVDSIRSFSTRTQRSIEKYPFIEIAPTKELIFSEQITEQALNNFEKEASKYIEKTKQEGKEDFAKQVEDFSNAKIEEMQQGQKSHWEFYLSYIKEPLVALIDYFSKDDIIFLDQPHRVKEKHKHIKEELEEDFNGLLEKGHALPKQFDMFFSYHAIVESMSKRKLCIFQTLIRRIEFFQPQKMLSFPSKTMQPFHGKLRLLAEEIEYWKKRKYVIVLLSDTKEKGLSLSKHLEEFGIAANVQNKPYKNIMEGEIVILPGVLHKGVAYPEIHTVIVSENEIFSQVKKKGKKRKTKRKRKIESFIDLNIGDYVVHESYGIGKYLGMEKMEVESVQRDYLHIKYARGDKLYVPTEQMDLIQPYVGAASQSVRLNKLGGNTWQKAKGKVKKAIEDMTEELLSLYAQRQTIEGYTFSKDTPWQREFEEGFPYEETPDQLQSIEEVKKDMESSIVMDRLLCGDVGYGKTEVAIRAAFKAVMDGKQVAFLVPTTILAQQHFNNMVERFSDYPISIAMLSRFRNKSEIQETLKDIKSGMVDIVIGTHRIVQRDIKFKDLGLLVIDEEQRFGVTHKERLKDWKKNVDVLTLTATPIPRTLHMSLVGIRDMSVIEEPPEERYPVQTYVLEHNEQLVRDAIMREMDRGGQVYYVYNRVEDIEKITRQLQALVPEARIAIGHGQMAENQLENTMLSFVEGQYDILVCTTIIETGLDMPNVNTIIVTNGDKMGLSQLYQLRGRVGRSNRLAYAYITYKKDKVLTEIAEKRLQAIKEFTEFGSGFKVAMRDLEIRGAGNLLGAEQHGHMAAIGYDLYCKLLEESIYEAKGLPQKIKKETSIELQVDAFIPDWYIAKESQRIQMYKKMVLIEGLDELYDIQEEIEDRFGDLPRAVNNLLMVSYIKSTAQSVNIYHINKKNNLVNLYMEKENFIDVDIIRELIKHYPGKIMINASEQPYISLKASSVDDKQLKQVKEVLEKIKALQVM